MGLRKILQDIHKRYNTIFDSLTIKTTNCSIGDIILVRGDMCLNDYIVASRVLDILEYKKGNNKFPYQTAVSRASYSIVG